MEKQIDDGASKVMKNINDNFRLTKTSIIFMR